MLRTCVMMGGRTWAMVCWILKGKCWSSWGAVLAGAKVFDALWEGKEEKNKADYQGPSVIEHSRTAPPLEATSPKRDTNIQER